MVLASLTSPKLWSELPQTEVDMSSSSGFHQTMLLSVKQHPAKLRVHQCWSALAVPHRPFFVVLGK